MSGSPSLSGGSPRGLTCLDLDLDPSTSSSRIAEDHWVHTSIELHCPHFSPRVSSELVASIPLISTRTLPSTQSWPIARGAFRMSGTRSTPPRGRRRGTSSSRCRAATQTSQPLIGAAQGGIRLADPPSVAKLVSCVWGGSVSYTSCPTSNHLPSSYPPAGCRWWGQRWTALTTVPTTVALVAEVSEPGGQGAAGGAGDRSTYCDLLAWSVSL